ncbi:AMP-dependent synthetase/ligase [Mangrovibacterium diazotrophicum]|uniref:Long-chain acyl-CoA synthetase n=1 Tax=Mangrovibacterium diazotrophicum TaxID=1261403 RepID=A0A419W7F6_9BACT|nr:long-chain fatty acid--CoA ligase [Mangrovibacterium diazotrophicum]RKD91292.1 long-chain acyl-CoA synthetase [Mangrovibacterium diazotrophicum]
MTFQVTRTFDILDRIVQDFPRKDALAGKNESGWYTYSTAEYAENSKLFALGVMSLGLKTGDKVATVTSNRPEWNFADMGLGMAGMVHVPIYPTIGDDEYRYILEHAEVQCLIVGDKKLFEKLQPIAKEIGGIKSLFSFDDVAGCRNFNEILELGKQAEKELLSALAEIRQSVRPQDVATLIYTSGTTGVPKGVMLSHENLVANFSSHATMHDLGKDHRVISFLPLCHVYERSVNYHFQYKGMGIYYVGNLGQIVNAIKEIKPHMFNSVPRLLERVYDGFVSKGNDLTGMKKRIYFWALHLTRHFEFNKRYNPIVAAQIKLADKLVYSKWREALGNNITYIVSGGAALQPRIARVLGMAGMYTLEGYGLTETSPVIAVNNPASGEMKIGTVGPILDGVTVKIADDGEILCKGPSVMLGYYKAPELTAEVIDEEGWFHTGDIGFLDEGKYLKITDRKKEMFKMSGGKYIAPQMIENKLKESFFIEQAMVIGENEKFASALISPNFDYLHDWCSQHKIHFRDNQELVQVPEVVAQYKKEVAVINKTLGEHEEIKRFKLVCEEWSPQNGELSPTLKLKRNYVVKKYQHLIDDIYAVTKNGNGGGSKLNLRFDLNALTKRFK